MSQEGDIVKGNKIIQDGKIDWLKIEGVALGESLKYSYDTTASTDIGALLDRLVSDDNVIAIVYNWSTSTGYLKSGYEPQNDQDSKLAPGYTTFIKKQLPVYREPEIIVTKNSGFVERQGQRLYLDGEDFIAVGPNAYWLGYMEDGSYPTRAQQEEMFIAAKRMNSTAIRSHTLGHSSGGPNSLRPRDNNLNENAWESIDYAYSLAKKYDLKVVAPLTDCYFWYNGNYGDFCKTRGVPKRDFWTNRQVINDFKDYITKYLNHYNKYNKCMIKDDPSLGIIEIGNELGNIRPDHGSVNIPTFEWLKEISEHIKSIDHKHVVLNPADESLGQSNDFEVKTMDCYGAHFYYLDKNRLDYGLNMTRRENKPYIVGEYSSFSSNEWYKLLESKKVSGSFYWSMYPHRNGIMGGDEIPHNDGFTVHYSKTDERYLVEITNHFCRLRGLPEVNSLDFGKYTPVFEKPAPLPAPLPTPVPVPVKRRCTCHCFRCIK